ncbi:MAG: hypothetical protein JWP81_1731, partial [Ferruginibacter sp.]|nr:hypothetical protein [Ferruginibacter sp.]
MKTGLHSFTNTNRRSGFFKLKAFLSMKLSVLVLITCCLGGITTTSIAQSVNCVNGISVNASGPLVYCQATTASTLTATITTDAGSVDASIVYEWFGNSTSSTTGGISVQSPSATTTATTSSNFTPPTATAGTLWYYCKVTTTDATCTGISYTTAPVQVIVNPSTGPTTFLAGALSVCQNAPDEIYTASASSATSIVYSVSPGTAGVINSSTGVMNWDAAFSGTATITATSTGLCGTTSLDRVVIVNASTGATSFTAGATTICQDAPDETYTATAANSTSIVYSVLPLGAGTINPSTGVMNWNATFYGTATITATSTGLCGTTSFDRVVTVNVTLVPTVSITTNTSTTICTGTSVTFTALPVNGGANPTYQWYVGVTPVATGSTFTTTILTNGNQVKVVMTSNAICPVQATVTSNVITMTVNLVVAPSIAIVESPSSTICIGTSVTFTASTPNSGGINPAYQWQVNGTDVSGANATTFIAPTLSNGDMIRVKLTSNAACAAPNPVNSNEITMTVNPNATISLTSGNNSQTACINTTITNITYSTGGGGTGATVSGLPTGVSGSYSGGVYTISGTPSVSGTFNYTVSTTGTCAQTSTGGTITVNPNATISLTSGNSSQTVCINNAIASITFSVGLTGNNASVSGLPAGLSGSYNAGVFTISGIPTVNGSFTYTVTATGTCGNASAGGTLTINPAASIALSSAAGTNNQSKCISTAISNITYTISGGGTGATVSGLPTGVSGSYSGGVYTITGTPSVSGTFNYTVSTSGTCAQTSAGGTITVNPNATVSLTLGNSSQTVCINNAIASITFSVGLTGNNASVSGLPAGLSGSYNAGVFTISGTPTASGSFPYTVTATGTCGNATTGATLTVNANSTIAFTSAIGTDNQSKCINTTITNITYSIGGGGTGATVSGLPTGVSGIYSGGVYTISGTPSVSGTFNYTVNTSGSCVNTSTTGAIKIYTVPSIPPKPTVPVGQSNSICPVATGLIYSVPADPNVVTYNWFVPTGFLVTSGAGTNSITVTATTAAASGNVFVTATNPCNTTANSQAVPLTVGNFAYVNAGNDTTLCSITSGAITFALDAATAGATNPNNDISWTTSSGGSFSNASKAATSYTLTSGVSTLGGSITLTVSANAEGSCPLVSDQIVITVLPPITASISGATTICAGTNTNITFTATPNTTITFNTNQTIAVGATGTAIFTTPILNGNTSYTINSLSYTNLPACPRTISGSVTITVNPVVVTNANSDQTVCASSQNVTLAGSITGGATTGTWTGGSGIFNPNATTLNAIYTPSAAEITAGTITLTLTSADPIGPCGATNDAMVITINPAAVTNANVDQVVCASGPNVTLAGSITGGATTGTWSGGGGTFNPNNTTLNAIYTPSTAEIAAGTVTLTLTSADPAGPCGATNDAMVITINPSVVTNANIDQSVCASSPNVTLAGSITGGATTGTWSGGGGTFNPNNTTLNAIYTPSAAEIAAGTVTLTLTSADPAGPCGATNDAMVITINPAAVTNANVDQVVCASSPNVTLAGSIT